MQGVTEQVMSVGLFVAVLRPRPLFVAVLRPRGDLDGCEQMCTLHAVFVLGVCLRETWTVCRIVPCVHKMYTLGRFHGLLETFLFAVDEGSQRPL
jgi:hypothetical protein